MGIATGTFQRLIDEHSKRPFSGRLLTLGKQDIFLTQKDVDYWFSYYGVESKRKGLSTIETASSILNNGRITDKQLFENFGVSVESLDASDYEGCDHVFDLNADQAPQSLLEAFDIILDTGTFEHVFHIPNAFKSCHKALKPGGRIVHMSPSSNYVDHGFYMLSPTLFSDYYQANNWRIHQIKLIRHSKEHDTQPYWVTDYSPDHFHPSSFGGLDGYMYQTFVVAEKTENSTYDRIPQQRAYSQFGWKAAQTGNASQGNDFITQRIREYLTGNAQALSDLLRSKPDYHVAVFGTGTHSKILLQEWKKIDLPLPKQFFQSSAPRAKELDGIPITSLESLKTSPPDLIVLSSHSSEMEMAKTVFEDFEQIPLIRFWATQ